MIRIIKYLMNQKLLVNLVVGLIVIAGIVTLNNINREAFPEVNFDMVSVTTIYPGGSPDELEQLITIPLEKRLREVDGLDKVRSYNIENVSVIVIYIEDDASDKEQVVQDIKDAIAQEDKLPDKAQKPIVEEIKLDKKFIADLAVFGAEPGVPYAKLRSLADEIEDYLYEIDGVAEVEQMGYLDREYLVEVDPGALEKYRMGINTVINTLRNRNMDVPGGTLKIGDKEYVLRTKGQYNNIREIANTALMVNDAGFVTRIRDVARVTDTFEEPDVLQRYNGRRAIVFRIWKKRSADEIDLVNVIRNYIANMQKVLPKEVKAELFNDISRLTRDRISSLIVNAITGFALLALILMLLLGLRMSSIVAISIPVSFMVAFMGMKANNITLNVLSMFAMIMVLGMIVDFSIVVSENSHRYLEMGLPKRQAILKGVSEVTYPVTVTFLCICAAFTPLLFLTGLMGKFIRAIPIVLMICLSASWMVAMFVMPTHLNIFSRVDRRLDSSLSAEEIHFERGIFGRLQRWYKELLTKAIQRRYLTILILFILLIITIFLLRTGVVKSVFKPPGGAENIEVYTTMPQGTNLEANLRQARVLEKIIMKIPDKEFDSLHASVGEEMNSPLDPKPGQGTHKATFAISLSREKDRDRTAYEINDELRGNIDKAVKNGELSSDMDIRVEVKEMGPEVGKPVNVEIRGKDFSTIKKIAREYVDHLKTIENVYDVTIDLEEGKQEYRHIINDVMAARTGVSVFDAAMALNASFQGAVATSVRKGKDDIDIRVRFPERERKRRMGLEKVKIGTRTGGLVPLNLVTDVKQRPGFSQINRLNFKRLVQVQANLDIDKITSDEVNTMLADKFHDIEKRYPGYTIDYGGEQEDTERSMGELQTLFPFALLIIFILLAVFFRSLVLPLVVMIAIPFAQVGIVLALLVHGEPMSFMSTLGFFSLAGVIVSNTLVLVQFINYQRDSGLSLSEALIEGGVIRLRPVLLTSGTTVLALFPTIYGLGGRDYFVAPLGLAFGYGLIFATFITLVLVPCFYHVAEDLKRLASLALFRVGIEIRSEIYHAREEKVKDADPFDADISGNQILKKGLSLFRKRKD